MAIWRAYIDKDNGEHSRFYEFEADHPYGDPLTDHANGRLFHPELPAEAELEDDEVVNQIACVKELTV